MDELVRVVKAGAIPFTAQQGPGHAEADLPARLQEDLMHAVQLIEALGDELAEDEAALARHGQRLMDLDIAIQTIGAVAGMLGDGDEAALSRLENLRTSYGQAARR